MKKYFVLLIVTLFFLSMPNKALAIQTANPNASAVTKQVLNYIDDLQNRTDNRVISGQFVSSSSDGLFSTNYNKYIPAAGKKIGIVGADFLSCNKYEMLTKLKEHWDNGGLVTISWHMRSPWTSELPDCENANWGCLTTPRYDGCGYSDDLKNVTDISELYSNPQSAVYKRWHLDLDRKAEWLAELQNRDNSVVVLFRPFHEMNGTSWNWWGARQGWTSQQFADHSVKYKLLWQHLFNYYTNQKGLHNLLWVFAPNRYYAGIGKPNDYYPGDAYVDIIGLDYYYKPEFEGYPSSDWSHMFEDVSSTNPQYANYLSHPKPFTITEFGPGSGGSEPAKNTFDYAVLIQQIKKYIPKTVYFMPWNGNYAIINQNNASGLLNDPWVANIGEIDWKITTTPINTPTLPASSPTPSSCPLKSSGDFNCDGKINESDLNSLLGKWMTGEKDITGDGKTNESDLNKLLGNWKTL